MQGHGRDESAPTPGGMFTTNFVGVLWVFRWCSWIFHGVFVALSQSVRSRRGRFIVPAYMNTPTKWETEMCVR
ncbi:hypothetical protein [Prevotella pallens]|uniref:hypothetical protein n=1 Tax=uncultured Prevotella sp. TaxID=159272 RepID=UPI00258E8895|nr:hypothetical protein [Prevotella pallens]